MKKIVYGVSPDHPVPKWFENKNENKKECSKNTKSLSLQAFLGSVSVTNQ